MREIGIVLKNSEGFYYCGLNTFSKELRKAKIYKSKKYAQEAIDTLQSDWEKKRRGVNYNESLKRDFILQNIEIREIQ